MYLVHEAWRKLGCRSYRNVRYRKVLRVPAIDFSSSSTASGMHCTAWNHRAPVHTDNESGNVLDSDIHCVYTVSISLSLLQSNTDNNDANTDESMVWMRKFVTNAQTTPPVTTSQGQSIDITCWTYRDAKYNNYIDIRGFRCCKFLMLSACESPAGYRLGI